MTGKPDFVRRRVEAPGSSFLSGPFENGPAPRCLACARRGGCGIPAAKGRAVQPPILPCTGLGFSCRRCCLRRGGLLPHLFTLTARSELLVLVTVIGSPLSLLPFTFTQTAQQFVFCDTVRHGALTRRARAFTRSPALGCPDFPLLIQRTRSEDQAPKLGGPP